MMSLGLDMQSLLELAELAEFQRIVASSKYCDLSHKRRPIVPVQSSKDYHTPSPKVNEAMTPRDTLISSHE